MPVDYDPQKAHEYYEKHKNLKGRHSTKKFTQSQKEQWEYAKDQLKTEHKAINKQIGVVASEIRKQMQEEASNKIKALRERLKNAPKDQKKKLREEIKGMSADIREKLKADKANFAEGLKGVKEKEKNDYEERRDQAYQQIKGGG